MPVPTNKFKINWAWGVVENADSYEVSLAEVKSDLKIIVEFIKSFKNK